MNILALLCFGITCFMFGLIVGIIFIDYYTHDCDDKDEMDS